MSEDNEATGWRPSTRRLITKLGPPLVVSAGLASAIFVGGDAYWLVGLQALQSTSSVLGRALTVATIFSVAVLVQRIVRYVILEGVARTAGAPVPRLLPQITGAMIYVIAAAAVASLVFDQDLTALWAASGVAGVVFGMALREMILDVFSGVALNIDRPIRLGDRIQVLRSGLSPLMGAVSEISWRSTRINTEDGNMAVVPNSIIAGSVIINMSLPEPIVEFLVPVTLDNDVPPERAMRILTAAAREAAAGFAPPGAPPPYVRLRAVTPGGAEYGVFISPRTEQRYRARSETLAVILRHLALAGLQPAWPKQEQRPETSASSAAAAVDGRTALLLEATALFQGLDGPALDRLAAKGRSQRIAGGGVLVQSGEVATAFFLVLEGVLQEQPGGAYRGPGAVIGAEAMLAGVGYDKTLVAAADSLLITFGYEAARAFLLVDTPENEGGVADKPADTLIDTLAERIADAARTADPLLSDEQTADLAADVAGGLRRMYGVSSRSR